jgi:RNase adaptor protein for sRNA GlmZ degradation
VGLGCTGGRHRAPVLARELMNYLKRTGYDVSVRDNDIAR